MRKSIFIPFTDIGNLHANRFNVHGPLQFLQLSNPVIELSFTNLKELLSTNHLPTTIINLPQSIQHPRPQRRFSRKFDHDQEDKLSFFNLRQQVQDEIVVFELSVELLKMDEDIMLNGFSRAADLVVLRDQHGSVADCVHERVEIL